MSTAPLEEKIKKGFVRHGKDIANNTGNIGKEFISMTKEVGKGVYKVGEAGLETSMAVGKGVYGMSKATVETGVAATKTALAMATFPYRRRRSVLDYFWKSKRGMITGAADNDPSGIVTYIQTGAAGGYLLLWLAPLAWPLLYTVEEMSARIGIVVKKGLSQVIRENFGSFWVWLVISIIIVCNTVTIGADIAAMSNVANILTGLPNIVLTLFFGLIFIYVMYKKNYGAISRWLFILTPIFLLYLISAYLLNVDWTMALKNTFIPSAQSLSGDLAMLAVGFLGTTITPFLLFWETTQEVEENRNVSHLKREKLGIATGMFFTQFITFFIVVAAAAAFAGNNHILSSARDAATALKPFGTLAFLLFSFGIIGSGLIAIPVLSATTAYAFSETMSWSKGLSKSFSHAKGFYIIILLSILIGIIISLSGYNPIMMLFYSQVLNGILMPILLILLLVICNKKKVMGEFTNKFWSNFVGILTVIINIVFIIAMFIGKAKI